MSKIVLSEEREDAIREFNYLIENFMQIKSDYVNIELGEEMVIDRLIVMEDVSGLAGKSDCFANFLTASRKIGFSCLFVFHTIYPNRQNWEMIMAQTHVFNFFPVSIHSGKILKTFYLFATRYKNRYVPTRNVWISKLYFDISTAKQKQCLTVDTRTINDLGPGKFRTQADNNIQQICYYSRNKSDTHSNSFLATRKQTLQKGDIKFSVNKIITSLNCSDVRYINLSNELKNIDNDTF